VTKYLLICALLFSTTSPSASAGGLRGETQLDQAVSPAGAYLSSDPAISSTGYFVHAVWTEAAVPPATTTEVYYCRSEDGGKHWSTPVLLSSNASIDDGKAQIAADGDLVVAVWLHGTATQDVQGVVSIDGGLTFGVVKDLSGSLMGDAGDADGLRLKLVGQNIYMTFEDDVSDPGANEDVYVISSSDGGTTFSSPVRINDSAAGTVDCDDPEIETTGTTAYLVWIDKRTLNDRVYFSTSTDSGANWSADRRLDRAGAVADTGSPSMDVEGSNLHVVWVDDRNNPAVADEVFYVSSSDSGVTFTLDKKLGSAASGTDADDPRVSVSGATVYAAWVDDRNGGGNDVFLGVSSDSGSTFAAEFALDPDAGSIHDISPHLRSQGDSVLVTYLEETATATLHQVWLSYSANRGSAGSFQRLELSATLGTNGDADGLDVTISDARDVIGIWTDDRAGGLNNDVYLNGQRFPNLTAIPTPNGKKVAFHLSDATPADDGHLFLAAFSLTGTNSWELDTGLNVCLTVDGFTQIFLEGWAIPLVSATIVNGEASTLNLPFKKFDGYAVGVVVDITDPDNLIFLATTDPIPF